MKRLRHGFTLVELLVVIAIVAIMVLMLLPAINSMRESARRTQCINRMSQLIIGVHSHEMSQGFYPAGVQNATGPIVSQPQGFHHSWTIALLPFVEEDNVYRIIDHEKSVYAKSNRPARDTHLTSFICPSSPLPVDPIGHSNYAAVHHDVEAPIDNDNRGVFFLDSRISQDDVTDGTRYTLFLGEKILERGDLGWMSGTRATLRNTGTPINTTDLPVAGRSGLSQQFLDDYETEQIEGYDFELETPDDEAADGEDGLSADDEETAENLAAEGDQPKPEAQDAPTENSELEEIEPEEADPVIAEGDTARRAAPPQDAKAETDRWAAARKAGLYVGGFGSHHPGGSVFAFGDGHVRTIDNGIDFQVYQHMGGRADGKVIDGRVLD